MPASLHHAAICLAAFLVAGAAGAQEPERRTLLASSARVGLSSAAQVQVIGISGRLNIRGAPSTQSPIIGQVRAGTRLDTESCVVRLERLWCGVRWSRGEGQIGWAAAEYLLPAGQPGDACGTEGAKGAPACPGHAAAQVPFGVEVSVPPPRRYGPEPYLDVDRIPRRRPGYVPEQWYR